MAISIITEPAAVSFSRQPIKYVLETNNHQTVTEVTHESRITFSASTPDASTLTFVWGSNEVIMTATTGGLNAESTNYTYDATLATHLANLVLRLNSNFLLSNDFTFSVVSGTYILVTAREPGTAFEMVITSSSGNATHTDITNGVDAVFRENFKILVEVWTRDANGIFLKAITEEYDVDETGLCEFDISEVLHAYFKSFVFYNAFLNPEIFPIASTSFIRYSEKFGNPQSVYSINKSEEFSAWKGAFNTIDYNIFGSIPSFFTNSRFVLNNAIAPIFFTNNEKPEYLIFICRDEMIGKNCEVKFKLYFTDNTDTTFVLTTSNPSTVNELILINCGIYQNALQDIEPAKTISKYEVWIEDDEFVTYGQLITFIVKEKKLNNTYFIYENSIGGIQTKWFTGEREEGVLVDKIEFETLLNFKSLASTQANFMEEFGKVNTGTLTKYELMEMKDFLFSDNVYFAKIAPTLIGVTGFASYQQKVNINKGSFQLYKQSDDIYNLSFSYTFAEKETGYSNLLNL